jgi:hypothetical protein
MTTNDPPPGTKPSLPDLIANAQKGGWQSLTPLYLEALRLAFKSGAAGRAEVIAFLRTATPRQWLVVDGSMRRVPVDMGRRPLLMSLVDSLRRSGRVGTRTLLRLGLSTMSADGYRREVAIKRIADLEDPLVGPFLALRTIDWVGPVARTATEALIRRMESSHEVAAMAAPLVFAFARRMRAGAATEAVSAIVARDVGLQRRLLGSPDPITRRLTLDLAVGVSTLSTDELVELALRDTDTVVATRAGHEAVARAQAADDGTTLTRLLQGRAPVRRAVLDALPSNPAASMIAREYLFDPSPKVRAGAQQLARRTGTDPDESYRSEARAGDRRAIAVLELGYAGTPQDKVIVLNALTDAEPRVRRAAVLALRRLTGLDMPSLLVGMLSDSSAGVVRVAERGIRPHVRVLDRGVIDDLLQAAEPHIRRAGIRVLRRRSDHERLEADFMTLTDTDERLRRDASQDLRSWLRRRAARAPRVDLGVRKRLARQLAAVESSLDAGVVEKVRFHAGLRTQDLT